MRLSVIAVVCCTALCSIASPAAAIAPVDHGLMAAAGRPVKGCIIAPFRANDTVFMQGAVLPRLSPAMVGDRPADGSSVQRATSTTTAAAADTS